MIDSGELAARLEALADLVRAGRAAEALPGIDTVLAARPSLGLAHFLKGVALLGLGRAVEAADAGDRAAALDPVNGDALWLALVARDLAGDLDGAIARAREGTKRHPERVDFGTMLALLSDRAGAPAQAYDAARAARDRHPSDAKAAFVHAMQAQKVWRLAEAEAGFARTAELDPGSVDAQFGLGNCALEEGRFADANAAYERALALRPDYEPAWLNRLYAANYDPAVDAAARRALHEAWAAKFAAPHFPAAPPVARDPGKRLRVGYVSGDFRTHSVAPFVRPLFRHHDRAGFEVVAYSNVEKPDGETEALRALADEWRPIFGIDDDAAAAQIRADGIDILVDLAAHTAGNRLGVFARKPAPVQASWLGYCGTSGLRAIDWFLTDRHIVPDGHEAAFTEGVWRMDHAYAFEPQAALPAVAPSPGLAGGAITFGHFGRLARLNDGVLRVWARVLAAVPGSRLMLNTLALNDAAVRARLAARFAANGGDPARLDLASTHPQPATWAAYARIDIALDPFPFNAGATTFEALWLGVPVLTLDSTPPFGRMGASILRAAGMANWVAADADAYVARARRAAADPAGLATLRASQRDRLRASPLLDGPGFVRGFEAALRAIWARAAAR
ncbi:MAG: tetratricopeptide repeat protein [Azospirillum sp.]|nr:tetratricopeptide repeat protein [Azospirillum sp.]